MLIKKVSTQKKNWKKKKMEDNFFKKITSRIDGKFLQHFPDSTAGKVSVFGVFLIRIFPDLEWIRTKKNPNMDTFYAVFVTAVKFLLY